ncbi:MAG: tripartite tricarboxylate transporter substrate binding protein [Pseudomonadota bacterium]
MKILKNIAAATAIAALVTASLPAVAQTYPTKPVELVVAFQPGGGVDTMARVFAEAARPHLGQSFIVVNKPGASGAIGLSYVANAQPDGYKVAMVFAELLTVQLLGIAKVSHEDFQPIAKFASDPSTLTVRADAPWKTIEEFLAYAKANPAKVTVSNAGNGSISHISAAALGHKTGTQYTHVPYQGSAPAVLGLLSGQVDATTVNYSVLSPHIASGKLRTLASMSDKRYASLAKVPTLKERGVDLSVDVWRGIAVAKGTPKEIVDTLRQLSSKVARDPKLLDTLQKQNLTFAYEDGDEFARTMARESERFRQIIPELGIKN